VNKSQKILTAAFLILLTASLLCFPWRSFERHSRLISPFWIEPGNLGLYPLQWTYENVFEPDWRTATIVWVWLGIVYVGLLFILKSPSK
jgi:hypothetical protein